MNEREQVLERYKKQIDHYIETGEVESDMIYACLTNDFVEATTRADNMTYKVLVHIARYIYSYVPHGAWGSEEAVREYGGKE